MTLCSLCQTGRVKRILPPMLPRPYPDLRSDAPKFLNLFLTIHTCYVFEDTGYNDSLTFHNEIQIAACNIEKLHAILYAFEIRDSVFDPSICVYVNKIF